MNKASQLLFLSLVFLFGSGFGAPENNTYVNSEKKTEKLRSSESKEVLVVEKSKETPKKTSDKISGKSVSQIIGEGVMVVLYFCFNVIVEFVTSFLS